MAERYATCQDISPDLIDNSRAPFDWKLRTDVIQDFPRILAEQSDRQVPEGYRFVMDHVQRVQVRDPETGEFSYVFQYRRLYERESADV